MFYRTQLAIVVVPLLEKYLSTRIEINGAICEFESDCVQMIQRKGIQIQN